MSSNVIQRMFGRSLSEVFFLGASAAEEGHTDVPANAAEHIRRESLPVFIYKGFVYKIIG